MTDDVMTLRQSGGRAFVFMFVWTPNDRGESGLRGKFVVLFAVEKGNFSEWLESFQDEQHSGKWLKLRAGFLFTHNTSSTSFSLR